MIGLLKFLFSGWIFKLLIVVAGIYSLYYFKIWPFQQDVADIQYLKKKYCGESNSKQDKQICNCIITKLENDLKKRFSASDLDEFKKDRLRNAYVLQKSMEKIKTRSKVCLEENNEPEAWGTFVRDLATLDNDFLGKIGDWVNSGADVLKEKWNERQEERKLIDEKFEGK